MTPPCFGGNKSQQISRTRRPIFLPRLTAATCKAHVPVHRSPVNKSQKMRWADWVGAEPSHCTKKRAEMCSLRFPVRFRSVELVTVTSSKKKKIQINRRKLFLNHHLMKLKMTKKADLKKKPLSPPVSSSPSIKTGLLNLASSKFAWNVFLKVRRLSPGLSF